MDNFFTRMYVERFTGSGANFMYWGSRACVQDAGRCSPAGAVVQCVLGRGTTQCEYTDLLQAEEFYRALGRLLDDEKEG